MRLRGYIVPGTQRAYKEKSLSAEDAAVKDTHAFHYLCTAKTQIKSLNPIGSGCLTIKKTITL